MRDGVDIKPIRLLWGTAAKMHAISNEEADLVFAGPPYFSDETEKHLFKPLTEQTNFDLIEGLLKRDTESLAECYQEIGRILKPGGALVIQIKDIKFGDFYIPISGWHLELANRQGLRLITQISWLPSAGRAQTGAKSFIRKGTVRSFRALETERFYILSHPSGLKNGQGLGLQDIDFKELVHPLWSLPPNGRRDTHPYSSPESVAKKLISLLTEPGELVVDPFAGFGGVLKIANKLGRNAIGYEIDMEKWIDRKNSTRGQT